MERERYEFAPFAFDFGNRTLLKNGVALRPGHRALALLEALIDAEGQPVAKAKLMDAAWPSTAVEESNLTVQIAALRRLLGRKPDGGEWIDTVQRIGYQFLPPVAGIHSNVVREQAEALTDGRPAIAVLPFENFSANLADAFFSDGLTSELIAGLSRLREVFVIARTTMFTYKSKPVNVQSLGEELAVNYVIEGSVRASGGRIRVLAPTRGYEKWQTYLERPLRPGR